MTDKGRLTLWIALSDLFLDTEVDERTVRHIAQTIDDSAFTLEQVEDILWYEVYPALESNLRSPAGMWSGWPDEWLKETIESTPRPASIRGARSVINEIIRCWVLVCEHSKRSAK